MASHTPRASQHPRPHIKPTATPFRRANKSPESWALSDFGRLTMTPRVTPVQHELPPPRRGRSSIPLASVSPTSSNTWTTLTSNSAPSVLPYSRTSLRSLSPSYATPSPLNDCTSEPDSYPIPTIRERQDSTASTSSISSTSSSSTTSSGYSSCTEYEDELPDYNTFLTKQGRVDQGVVQSTRIVGEWLQWPRGV